MTSHLYYFDDLQIGHQFLSPSYTIDKAEMLEFAREFDPQPFHLDDQAAQASVFGGLVASGWHTAAITMKLLVAGGAPLAGGIVGIGGELQWSKPTFPGDTLQVHVEVVATTPSKTRPDRGTVTMRCETRNQHGDPVQIFTGRLIVPRRPAAKA